MPGEADRREPGRRGQERTSHARAATRVYGVPTVSRRHLALLVVLSAIWGASFLFIKVGVRELAPSVVVLGRLVVGTLVLLPLTVGRAGLAPLRGRIRSIAILSAFNNALPFWLLGFAEERIDSGLTAIIQASAPILTVLLASRVDPSQTVTRSRFAGIAVGFVGVALLVGGQPGHDVVGALAVVGTAACYAFSVLFAGRVTRDIPPLQLSIGQLGCAAILVAPVALAQLPSHVPSWKPAASVVALGALGSGLAYLLYFALIHGAGASRAILVTYLVPAFAVLYGATILDEPVTLRALGGLALILSGTAVATGLALRARRARAATAER